MSVDVVTALVGFDAVTDAIEALRADIAEEPAYAVGTNVDYAPHQELGTSKMPPQPHLGPAINEVERELDRLAAEHDTTRGLLRAAALETERKTKAKAPVDTGHLRASYRAEKLK